MTLHQLQGNSLLGVVAFLALYNMVIGISLVMSSYVFLCLTWQTVALSEQRQAM